MPGLARLKRRMVRELVQENVALLHGSPLLPHRRLHRHGGRATSLLILPLVWLGLLGSANVLSSLAVDPPPRAVVAALAPTMPLAPALSPRPGTAPVALAAARTPVDATVFPLAVRKVVIDAGHGGNSLGTRTSLGLLEKEVTLDVAGRLRKLLEAQHAFEVVLTRDGDRAVPLGERAAIANRAGADVFVSIHVNWIENRTARGVETYFLGPTNDPYLTRLAAAENRDSGYSMTDLRQLLERLYAGVRQDKSRKLAEMVQAALYGSLSRVNPQLENRGVKAAPFIVLLTTEMPAILAEVSCMSNEEEAKLLRKPLYRQYIAEALANGLKSYAERAAGADGKGI
jgi:N-acetylmuramoyl-L-alanine amidase